MIAKDILKLVGYYLDDDEITNSITLNTEFKHPTIFYPTTEVDPDDLIIEQNASGISVYSSEENTSTNSETSDETETADTENNETTGTEDGETDEQTDSEQVLKKVNKLLKCLNHIYQDLTRDYMPLVQEEEVLFVNNMFGYSNLSKVARDIISVKDEYDENVVFKCFPRYLKASVKKATITYTYQPDELYLYSEITDFAGKIDQRIIAYGVAMEYCFLSSLSDEVTIWENRYLSSLENALRKKSNIVLPKRRWI